MTTPTGTDSSFTLRFLEAECTSRTAHYFLQACIDTLRTFTLILPLFVALSPMLRPVTPGGDSLPACGLHGAASMTFTRTAPQQLFLRHLAETRNRLSLVSKVAWVGVTSALVCVHVCLQSVGCWITLASCFFTRSLTHTCRHCTQHTTDDTHTHTHGGLIHAPWGRWLVSWT